MAAKYVDLMNQAQKLIEEAEKLKQKEIEKVIAEIRETMASYGLTARDIAGAEAKTRKRKAKAAAKYRGPNGELWSGGRGRKPQWVIELLEAGKSIENYKIR